MIEKLRGLSERAEFVIVVVVAFSYSTAASVALLLRHVHTTQLSTARVLRGIALEMLILLLVVAFLSVRGWRPRRFGFQFSFTNLIAGIGLFVVCMVAYWVTAIAVYQFFPNAFNEQPFHFVRTASTGVMLAFIVVNSVFEEFTVAGYVVNALSSEGAALSITASTLIRFAYHLYQGPVASLTILPLGILFAAVYWHWRNLWPLFVAHTVANVVSFFVYPQAA